MHKIRHFRAREVESWYKMAKYVTKQFARTWGENQSDVKTNDFLVSNTSSVSLHYTAIVAQGIRAKIRQNEIKGESAKQDNTTCPFPVLESCQNPNAGLVVWRAPRWQSYGAVR